MTASPQQAKSHRSDQATSLAQLVAVPGQPSAREFFTPVLLAKVLIVGALLVAFNLWQFPTLFRNWSYKPNWTHGFIIPLFSLYLLYARCGELFAAKRRVCVLGAVLLLLSIVFVVVSMLFIHTTWLCNLGMVAMLFSAVLYLAGPSVIRITWLPILFLVFAMPLPERIYTGIAVPLQEFAAELSTVILKVAGAEIDVSASALTITTITGDVIPLTVAEACSGVRSLMAFMALGVAWAYLEQRPIWQRLALVAFAVPIAIFCNVIRVTTTCAMYVVDKPELGKDFMHTFTGMLMLGPALLMFWGLSKLLRSVFVEVEVEEDEETVTSSSSKTEEASGE